MIDDMLTALLENEQLSEVLATKLAKSLAETLLVIDINADYLKKSNQELFEEALYFTIPVAKQSIIIIDKMIEDKDILNFLKNLNNLQRYKNIDIIKSIIDYKNVIKLHTDSPSEESKQSSKIKFS